MYVGDGEGSGRCEYMYTNNNLTDPYNVVPFWGVQFLELIIIKNYDQPITGCVNSLLCTQALELWIH